MATTAALLQALLQAGADPAAARSSGGTALHEAATLGSLQCAQLLLLAGAPWEAVDGRGDSPLKCARRSGWTDIAGMALCCML
jgi:uncharacterized protein